MPKTAGVLIALSAGCALPVSGATSDDGVQPRWNQAGHEIVCQIAWTRVSEATRGRIVDLLALDPDYQDFAPSCVWADDIRAQIRDGVPGVQRLRRFTTAHYMNSPAAQAGVDTTCAIPTPEPRSNPCVLGGIHETADRLANDPDPMLRLEALKFLGHFVGDIHQPLHAGYGEDRGGNNVRVSLMGAPDQSLHSVWDAFFLEHGGSHWADVAADLAGRINPIDERLWSSLDPVAWANESYQLVEREVYADLDPDGAYVGQQYYDRHILTVERQLMKAGLRLALLLDQVLGP